MQKDLFERHADCFEEIRNDVFDGSLMAAFRYVKPMPLGAIRTQAKIRRLLSKLPF